MKKERVLRASAPVKRVLGAAPLPRSPRGYHVLVITRCVLALLLASGCVSKPDYEQVSSAVEVEREAHKRTYEELVRQQARLRALEGGAGEAAPAVEVAKCVPSQSPHESVLAAQKAELEAERQKVALLEREKRALNKSLAEKEALVRTLREREATRSAELAQKEERLQSAFQEKHAQEPQEESSFRVDPTAPPPLPAQARDTDGEEL